MRHHAAISPGLGNRFYDEISAALRLACAHPYRYRMFEPPVRRVLASGFPYAVLSAVKPGYVWVLAIALLKRDPNYWQYRLAN